MKFIRDIISEKARLSAERAADAPPPDLGSLQSVIAEQPPETDLASEEFLQSSSDMPDMKPDVEQDPFYGGAVSWDAPLVDENESVETDEDLQASDELSEVDSETASELAADTEVKSEESLDDDPQSDLDGDTFDLPEVSTDEPYLLTDAPDLMTSHDADATEAQQIENHEDREESKFVLQSDEDANSPTADVEEDDDADPQMEPADDSTRGFRDAGMTTPRALPTENNLNGRSPSPFRNKMPDPVTAPVDRSAPPTNNPANAEFGNPESVSVPAPAVGRGAARAGRVKTRLLGFNPGHAAAADPFDKRTRQGSSGYTQFPVGWLIIVDGHGKGSAFTLFDGVSQIGRGSDQTVCLDFGDNSISRENHAVVAYDSETRKFYLGHGGKTNLVRLNNRPVLSTEEIETGNTIRIGETTLRFVGLCGSDFQWQENTMEERQNVSYS